MQERVSVRLLFSERNPIMSDHQFDYKHTADHTSFTLDATRQNIEVVQDYVKDFLRKTHSNMRTLLELDMLVEEIFINIASYSYGKGHGTASIDLALNKDLDTLAITFRDRGVPYNPLMKPDPDVSAPIEDRPIGGLGIFLVQKYSDGMLYEYKNNENCLTIYKRLR